MTQPARSRSLLPLFLIVVVAAVAILVMRMRTAHAPLPEVFRGTASLDEALARAEQTGKPVLVFATASWCPPCQRMKRTTLTDDNVTDRIAASTIPVYLDVDESQDAASRLRVRGIPAFILIEDRTAVARVSGYAGAEDFARWLDDALAETDAGALGITGARGGS